MAAGIRADQMLVERGLVESRAKGQALILAGLVFSGDKKIEKAGQPLKADAPLEVKGKDHPWVSRGGIKLAHGLQHFGWDANDAAAIDVGSSTGGFTDVLLTNGAKRVYAVDSGKARFSYGYCEDRRP
jgi:23S rRNA (cytidine1920-2'-O)/16S rRNA (cytidine1409-2'-O)-methyltransferase